ncbi:competence type IV pilus major pilin ComGC [uncultured Limosilactobacillus sp.]|uniref:competence type IV pilus major pilin ComGC n=1 Tax=uncultured Limosilactobacillus sp. TaxID=2837629 RepID=UPI0025E4C9A2|nr:competence type IV pilus major pilin ComGC [uncultured Limosilactobacillus sp.]
MKKQRSGFTLLEMSIVLFIISLLILIMIPNLTKQRQNASKVHQRAMMNVIQTQADLYANETGQLPTSLQQLYGKHYLTVTQVKAAQQNHLKFRNGQVVKE